MIFGKEVEKMPDDKLVRRAQSGNKEAFIALMEAHKLSMSRAALAILHNEEDTADAVAQTVMDAFSNLGALRQPGYFKTWLTRILIRNCYDILRQRRRYVPLDQAPEPAGGEPDDQALDVRESLAVLAENDRLVLTLYYMDDLAIREIARVLEVKESTVKTRLRRSRERLRKIYLEREDEPCEAK